MSDMHPMPRRRTGSRVARDAGGRKTPRAPHFPDDHLQVSGIGDVAEDGERIDTRDEANEPAS
jgi:hypothetical protein